jgi:protein-tyrosine phosphatase
MPTVLFICTANIIRSPIASALFDRKLEQRNLNHAWRSESAGTWAREGYPAARESQELLKAMGIDLSRHRSRMVNETILKGADLVLVMEKGHREALWFEFPAFRGRVFLLSEMCGVETEVRDPVGGTREDFEATIRDIDHWLSQGFSEIIQLVQGDDNN